MVAAIGGPAVERGILAMRDGLLIGFEFIASLFMRICAMDGYNKECQTNRVRLKHVNLLFLFDKSQSCRFISHVSNRLQRVCFAQSLGGR